MTTKATIAASTAGVCAILLSAGPLSAAETRAAIPGAFEIAQRGPDHKKDDDKDDKKNKEKPQREYKFKNKDSDGRGGQPNGKPDTSQKRGDDNKRFGGGKPDFKGQQPTPKTTPPPTTTQRRDDGRRDRHDGQGKQAQPPKVVTPPTKPAVTPSAKPNGDRDRRTHDTQKQPPSRESTMDKLRDKMLGKAGDRRGGDRRDADRKDDRRGDDRRDARRKDDRRGERPWRNTGPGFKDIQKQRKERAEDGGKRKIIEEPDKRIIVREGNRSFIRHDETERFRRGRGEFREERRKDGTRVSIVKRPGGIEIITVLDTNGRLLRRSRRSGGKEFVLIDNRPRGDRRHRHHHGGSWYVDLPPPVIRIPRDKYIVEYEDASEEDIYDALSAPPIDRLERGYSLDEIRESRYLRERMRRVDLDSINFEFGSWDVTDDQFPKLERVARAMNSILRRNADVVFMIEGHTDAVGSDVDNLSLSDRRAETVASILTEEFDVPPENLVTQGYGEEYLKVETDGPERANRRVSVLNITPLLERADR